MSGQDSYRPQGNGPHPTMAGNMFDPRVEADGMKGGLGVGGTNENTIKAEGAEHVAQHGLGHSGIGQTGLDATTTHGHGHHHGHQGQGGMTGGQSGLGQSQSGLGQGQSYDSGAYGSSGSHAQNLEGAGSTIGAGEPSAAETHGSGIDYLKSHSGAGRSGTNMGGAGLGSSAGGLAGTEAGRYDNSGTSTGASGTSTGAYGNTSTGGYSDSRTGMSGSGYDNSSNDPSTRQSGGNTSTDASLAAREITGAGDEDLGTGRGGATRDSNPRTSGAPVDEGSSRPMSKDHISGTTGKEQSSVAAAADSSDGRGGPPPSIPTAGGERIGTKHWGESKIIPDNPPRRPSEGGAGVSSSAGQSDDATKHNTHANSGDKDLSRGTSGEHKEGLMDKIKHTFGSASHNKEGGA